jgi:hypothetical protein
MKYINPAIETYSFERFILLFVFLFIIHIFKFYVTDIKFNSIRMTTVDLKFW